MADLTKDQLRDQNNTLFADNNSGNISAEDLRTFNDEMIDAVATEDNPSFTGSVDVSGSVTADTFFGDGSNLTGVISEVPSGTISGSSQVDYPLISNIPSGIISSSSQVDLSLATGVATSALTASLLEGNAEGVSHIDFLVGGDTTIEQRMSWNDTDGTLDIGLKGGNVTLQVGQELVTRVVNKSGVDLLEANYQVVQILGAQGNRLSVELADANTVDSQATLGLVTETILINQEGFVTSTGLVRSIDTRGPGLEDWLDGDILYLSPTTPGAITNVKPTAPAVVVKLGNVVTAAPNGSIYVKIEVGTALTELYDVTVTTPQSGDVLKYNSGLSLWENVPSGDLTGSFVQDTTFNTYTSSNDLRVSSLEAFTSSQEVLNATFATTGSNTFEGQQFVFGDILQPSGDITSANGRINAQNIGIIQGATTFTGSFVGDGSGLTNIPLDGRYATTGSNTFVGDQTINGTNVAPGQTFIAEDGNSTPRIAVNNATLSGLSGIDVILNGKTQIGDTLTLQGDEIINGTNAAPGDTFTAKDGNGTPRLSVQNATLSGLTGADVIVNGNLLNDGDTTITDSVIINDGGVNNNYIGIRANGGGGTLPNGKTSGLVEIQGRSITLNSSQPIQLNSGITMNGAVLMNTALYQNASLDLYGTGNNVTNTGDYFEIQLTSNTTINISSMIESVSRRVYLLIQQNASTAYTFSITQGGTPITVIASPGVYTSNFPTPTGTINIDTTLNSFTFVELIQTRRNGNESILHIRMNNTLDVGLLGAP